MNMQNVSFDKNHEMFSSLALSAHNHRASHSTLHQHPHSHDDYSLASEQGDDYQSFDFSFSYNNHQVGDDNGLSVENTPKTLQHNFNNLFLKREFSTLSLPHKNTDMEALLTILKYNLSVGILTLPSMFYMTGYALGAVLIIGVTILTGHSVGLLHEVNLDLWLTSQNSDSNQSVKVTIPYDEMCLRVLGEPGKLVFRTFSMISNIGACMAYIIFFEMYISAIIREQWSHQMTDEQTQVVGALIAFVIILPLSTINNVALFWQSNSIGLFLSFSALLLMLYRDFTLIINMGTLSFSKSMLWKSENFSLALGIIVYSFKIVSISMTIRNNMAEPLNFKRIFYLATAFTSAIFLFFGIVAELALGEYAADIALMNFAPFKPLGFFVRLFYILSVLLSYPLTFYVVVLLYENFAIFKKHIFCTDSYESGSYGNIYSHQLSLFKRYAVRYSLIVAVFMISLNSVKFSKLISFIGSFGGIMNQFTIPQLMYLTYFKATLSVPRKILGAIIIAICFVASFLGVFRSATDLFENHPVQPLEMQAPM